MSQTSSSVSKVLGALLIGIGLLVFIVRLFHDGPYAMPQGGGLWGGLGAIALGVVLVSVSRFIPLGLIVLVISPVALFPALYSIMGEAEEVISLYAKGADGETVDLRLWIVDREDGAWVGMGREKAVSNNLDGAQLEMLRGGELSCVVPVLHEDRPTARAIHAMKVDKYWVAQSFGALGLYPLEATESTVVLRLDPCEG